MNLPRRHSRHRSEPTHSGCRGLAGDGAYGQGADGQGANGQGAGGQGADRAAYLNWVATTVGEYGWAVSGIHGEGGVPPWAYSVGMWLTCQSVALVICGAPVENGASIINALGARLADGTEFDSDVVLDDVCPARLTFRPVEASWRSAGLLAASDAFYGMVRPPYLQVVWADPDGRFPWEPGFRVAFEGWQPWLWMPRDDNPPTAWTRLGQPR